MLVLFTLAYAWADGNRAIVAAARAQVDVTVRYDPAYRAIPFPNGDVPMEVGVCTDVVIRALRSAMDLDLQRLVHEDMTDHFHRYPQLWGATRPDRNIDHRRVSNLRKYFSRRGWAVATSTAANRFLPGDIVTCTVPPGRPHIMIIGDRRSPGGTPLVIHNIGAGTREEDCLFDFPHTGHYRIRPE
jgi:uncharacterized protein YijF (DUF1287 family)